MSEKIITVEMKDNMIIYTGSTERATAERDGIRHLTVIAVPVITDGENKGRILVHNRRYKQLAKGMLCPQYSYNLFGGHCNPSGDETTAVGKPVDQALLLENLLRELSEEMYLPAENDADAIALENKNGGSVVYAKPYPLNGNDLIPLGYTVYSSRTDNEYSFVYALSLTSEEASAIIAADDYHKPDGTKGNLVLPTAFMTIDALRDLYESGDDNIEICNAITRLWDEQNTDVLLALTNTKLK